MNQKIFTENIRALRKNSNYRQADVSRLLNIQRQTYCNYENASRTPPLDIVIALAKLYNVSVDYLLCGSNSASNSEPEPLSPDKQELLTEYTSLPENKQREVRDFIQFKKQLPY